MTNVVNNRACIVGAGPGGLALARAFKNLGIAFDVFERHSEVGGVWDLENPGTPMYDSAHFISSKTHSYFSDFPMPDHYPDYPSNRQIFDYMKNFARHYNLYDHITFNTEVTQTTFANEMWNVTLAHGETRQYRWMVCVSGTTWHPKMPAWASQTDAFDGEVRHANSFRHMDEFRGKRVLVVGAGNSGCDIACDAAVAGDAAFISVRRGYHFVPKHIMGKPADVFGDEGPHMPMWLAQRVFGGLLRFLNGDIRRFGLPKPDHKIFESHPIVNSQVLHYLGHGDLLAKGDVERLDGKEVVFKDGSREAVDIVLCATGYEWKVPYVDPAAFSWKGDRPDNYLHMFSRANKQLFGLGFTETNGGIYKLFDGMADLIARNIRAQRDTPSEWQKLSARIQDHTPDLTGGVKYVESDRHATYANIDALKREYKSLRKHMGWQDPQDGYFNSPATRAAASVLEAAE
ncbi:putative monooxygenase [Ascidiaceihabitans donghaensis]|uniref:Trimethylamine monooxygenase n=1 Tax=Ascidiaceihabitans donghaensis TaxID=1510460 RepID=A0A2R8BDA7_9RHOB|nr:NAD(P)-binding domain-containing protein [Ascidiaceihabitans donghaensis]SPH21070.1 putative monooxygenase [Ascidiaceihabitans donghaensis]